MFTCKLYFIITIYIACCLPTVLLLIPNKGMPEMLVVPEPSGRPKVDVSKNLENFNSKKIRGRLKYIDGSILNIQSIPRLYINSSHRQLFYTQVTESALHNSSSRDSSNDLFKGRRQLPERMRRKGRNFKRTQRAADDFITHRIIYPHMLHSRTKRSIDSSWDKHGHHNHIMVGLFIDGEDVMVDLQLNRELLASKYFEREVYGNGSHIVNHPSPKDSDMCHYQGFIKDRPGSWAAISTCDGMRGVVFDGVETHYVEPLETSRSVNAPHYLLSQRHHISKNYSCGYKGKSNSVRDFFNDDEFARLLRLKRSSDPDVIRGPFNSNALSRYVELFLVMDKSEFEKYDNNEKKIYQRCKAIANIVNALYQPLNIFIALTGVEIWKEKDQVEISTDGDKTLTNFLQYRKLRLIPRFPNDNAQLLTGKLFDSGVVGKALKGPICTYQYSGGVNMDHSVSVGLVATTVAHEMGHNFGMEHDTDDCNCPDKRCIMAPSSGTRSPSHWSSCSQEYLAISFERSMDYCLRNKPTSLFQSPVCGNGFVEPGEQCDCGLPQHCDNTCCNASSCMLFSNATCATGHCCDLATCRPKLAGTECRQAVQECDLPEYCSGDSEYCPANVYKENSMDCNTGKEKAYCYEGMCRTHENQCRLLWGPTGKNSHARCYKLNVEGNSNGNCGYNWANETYQKCNSVDIKCGMMHCKHFNERLEFGMESVSKVSHRFIADKNQGIIPCRVAQVDLGLDMVDPGLAPDGAKCGYNKMCVNQKCMGVAAMKSHVCDCNGRGWCNNKGHCHCRVGFAWPDCLHPGLGGSEDSGPASNPHATSRFVAVMLVFFLGIVPCGVLLCLVYYSKENIKLWLLRKGKSAPSLSVRNIAPNIRPKSVSNLAKKNVAQKNAASISAGSSPSQGSKSNSPLLNGYANGEPGNQFQVSFFGKHEGFTLSPIKEKVTTVNEESSDNRKKWTDVLNKGNSVKSPTGSITKVLSKRASFVQSPTDSINGQSKVEIGNPSLCASTNPAVEAPNTSIFRPAPAPPKIPPVAVVSPCRRAPSRPLSVPDATTLAVRDSSLPEFSNIDSTKEQKQSAVARLASFLNKKEKLETVDLPSTSQKCNTLPRKAAKINRENLMNMEISHPMQLQATELPSNLVPVRAAPEPPIQIEMTQENSPVKDFPSPTKVSFAPDVKKDTSGESRTFTRFSSVRQHPVTTRPFIPKFGSMRAPRPKSLPPTRPSQPPPRPPLPEIPVSSESDYFYEDCLSLQHGNASLAYDELSSPQESIYATIDDDSPISELPVTFVDKEKTTKKSLFSRFYSKPKRKQQEEVDSSPREPLYCNIDVDIRVKDDLERDLLANKSDFPKPITGREGGLLSEIVSELANREPQYVNSLSPGEEESPKVDQQVEYANTNIKLESSSISGVSSLTKGRKEPKLSQSSSAADNLRSLSSSKPRGVLSYLNKTKSEESPGLHKNINKDEDLASCIISSSDNSKVAYKPEEKAFPRSNSTPVPKALISSTVPKPNTSSNLCKPATSTAESNISTLDKNVPKTTIPKNIKISRPTIKTQSSVIPVTTKEKSEQQRKPNSASMSKISGKPSDSVSQAGKKTGENKSKPLGSGPPKSKSIPGLKTSAQKSSLSTTKKEKSAEPNSKTILAKKTSLIEKPECGPTASEKTKLSVNRSALKKSDNVKMATSSSRSGVLTAAAKSGPAGTSNVAALQHKFEHDTTNK